MSWKEFATIEEIGELERLIEAREAAKQEYNRYYHRLLRRCQSRIRYSEKAEK